MYFFRKSLRRIKLFVLYWRRIFFVKNNFKVGFLTKLKCNLFGGFLADQYILYDFKHNSKSQFLSEFDWYKSRYINAPFDFAFNNKVICSEILKQHIKVAEILFLKNRGILYDFKNGTKQNNDVFECLRERGEIIYKPFAMGKGDNVHLFSYINEKIYIDNKLSEKD